MKNIARIFNFLYYGVHFVDKIPEIPTFQNSIVITFKETPCTRGVLSKNDHIT